MPFIRRSGVRIHYLVQGHGPALVLQHGFAGAAGMWQRLGYVAALIDKFQVISIDARGHGASDKPHDAQAYTRSQFALDVLAVLDKVGVERAHYMGYSMGAWIGYGVAQQAPERLLSLHAGGSGLACERCKVFDQIDPDDTTSFLDAMELLVGEPLSARQRELIGRLDLHALTAMMRAPASDTPLDTLQGLPLLLFAGTEDFRHAEIAHLAQATQAEFFSVPECNHMQAIFQRELIVAEMRRFMQA